MPLTWFLPFLCQMVGGSSVRYPRFLTQGANCPIRSFPPITWLLSDWHFPFPDPGGFRV